MPQQPGLTPKVIETVLPPRFRKGACRSRRAVEAADRARLGWLAVTCAGRLPLLELLAHTLGIALHYHWS